jgi:hypothetical protein
MRILFTLFVTTTVVCIHILDRPEWFRSQVAVTNEAMHKLVQNKDIRVEGLSRIPRSVFEKLLPTEKSVPWWLANARTVQSNVAQNPWVAAVKVEGCGGDSGAASAWGCFVLSVTERTPRFVASVDGERWLIASDGTFLAPVDSEDWHGVKRSPIPNIVVVEGLASRNSSLDLLRSQLGVSGRAVAVLEPLLERRITSLTFTERGDLAIGFKGFPFPVVFNPSDDEVALEEQGQRCRALLGKLGERLAEVERVDLAFSRVGVVSFKVVEPAKKASSGASASQTRSALVSGRG